MNFTLGLVTLSFLAATGPQVRESPEISYTVRVIKMDGLQWRGAFYSRLQPVATHAGGTIWTTSREAAQELAELDPQGLCAPRVVAAAQVPAHISHRVNRKVASGLTRLADGPFDHATKVAYTPSYEEIREGFAITMMGRKLDQGVLACVVFDDTRVAALHQVPLAEAVPAKGCCEAGACPAGDKLASRIEVPEVVRSAVAGEWLIPNDGALVVSLGVQTVADADGKAVAIERLALIEASPVADEAVARAGLSRGLPEVLPRLDDQPTSPHAAATPMPMPMPAVPSRSLPQPVAADGSAMHLPPLPDEHVTPSTLPGSAEPCASPQRVNKKTADAPALDVASTKAGFVPARKARQAESESGSGSGSSLSSRPCLLRFPISAGGLDVEVEVRLATPLLDLVKPRAKPTTQD